MTTKANETQRGNVLLITNWLPPGYFKEGNLI